jgi:hypothetical protein
MCKELEQNVRKQIAELGLKVRIDGEYLTGHDSEELVDEEQWNIGERLFKIGNKLQELVR